MRHAARLRRSEPNGPGWTRRRRGRGFTFMDSDGQRLPAEAAQRCRSLAIPPAWIDVWICPWPNGHLQAVGTDSAGRRQYLYHPQWRRWRDQMKFARVLEFGASLPSARLTVAEHLALAGMPRERALATGFRLLDTTGARIGGEAYAEAHGTVGIATLRREHVSTRKGTVRLRFPGKGGRPHDLTLVDAPLAESVHVLLARRSGGPELLAWRSGRTWVDVRSAELNQYIREVTGCDATAKDFRTWQAAVRALAELSTTEQAVGRSGRGRDVAQAMRAVSEHLGNTPAVARTSYVHPVLVESYLNGEQLPVAQGDQAGEEDLHAWEEAVLEFLRA